MFSFAGSADSITENRSPNCVQSIKHMRMRICDQKSKPNKAFTLNFTCDLFIFKSVAYLISDYQILAAVISVCPTRHNVITHISREQMDNFQSSATTRN